MSITICDRCDKNIDSDFDCGCFVENPYDSKDVTVLCENCREQAWDSQQESLMESGPGPSLLDQQREAMRFK